MTGTSADSILEALADTAAATRYGVPGPTLEGYLYPATYSVPGRKLLGRHHRDEMFRQYKRIWTPERKARADSMNLTEREIITLASIVEKEAKVSDEKCQRSPPSTTTAYASATRSRRTRRCNTPSANTSAVSSTPTSTAWRRTRTTPIAAAGCPRARSHPRVTAR